MILFYFFKLIALIETRARDRQEFFDYLLYRTVYFTTECDFPEEKKKKKKKKKKKNKKKKKKKKRGSRVNIARGVLNACYFSQFFSSLFACGRQWNLLKEETEFIYQILRMIVLLNSNNNWKINVKILKPARTSLAYTLTGSLKKVSAT